MTLPPDPAAWEEWVRERAAAGLARAREVVDGLRSDPPAAALDVLRRWDEMSLALGGVAALGSLVGNVHPDEAVRTTAEQAEQDVSRLSTELSLDRGLYELFA